MKIMRRKLFLDKDKEETYLNHCAIKGESLYLKEGFVYLFEETKPQQYTYRIKCVKEKDLRVIQAQLKSASETIIKFKFPWLYLRKESKQGTFSRYDDLENRIMLYKRRVTTLLILSLIITVLTFLLGSISLWGYALIFILFIPLYHVILLLRKIYYTKKAIGIKKGSD
ncbi:MAG: DUF2812 domain-containing protein [Candidatus Izemoplasmataceae bacterium]